MAVLNFIFRRGLWTVLVLFAITVVVFVIFFKTPGIDPARLEEVSARALELGVLNGKGVASLLARKANEAVAGKEPPAPLFEHANLRGPGYYH